MMVFSPAAELTGRHAEGLPHRCGRVRRIGGFGTFGTVTAGACVYPFTHSNFYEYIRKKIPLLL